MPNIDDYKQQSVAEQAANAKTSLEAAALILSNGATSDPEKAVHYETSGGNAFDLDKLQQAHLRRMMGFDWGVDIKYKKLYVYSRQAPILTVEREFSGTVDAEAVDVLVEACMELKTLWDAEQAKEEDEEK